MSELMHFEPAASKKVLLNKLCKAQDPNGRTCWGERAAMVRRGETAIPVENRSAQ